MKFQTSFYSGTSNLVLPFKQSEYPKKFEGASRLTYYASLFRSVEVNATFYKLPKAATIEKWGNSVPDHFRFTFKLPKGITHAKGFRFNNEELELFLDAVDRVGNKKGCLLVQLPPSITQEKEEQLTSVLECLRDSARGWKIAVEFRHPSWYNTAVYRMLHGYKAGVVEHDMPKSVTPRIQVRESFVFIRFHGPDGTYRGSYENATLKGYAKRIAALLQDGIEVYAYFNNTMGEALGNLQTLNQMVTKELKKAA